MNSGKSQPSGSTDRLIQGHCPPYETDSLVLEPAVEEKEVDHRGQVEEPEGRFAGCERVRATDDLKHVHRDEAERQVEDLPAFFTPLDRAPLQGAPRHEPALIHAEGVQQNPQQKELESRHSHLTDR
jgi:hypothetical protein